MLNTIRSEIEKIDGYLEVPNCLSSSAQERLASVRECLEDTLHQEGRKLAKLIAQRNFEAAQSEFTKEDLEVGRAIIQDAAKPEVDQLMRRLQS